MRATPVDPDWNDFKIILALSRAGSVAGAARLLSVDSSTVSRRLTALEEAMGARLVLRGGRELGWTPEGRAALAAAEALEARVADATRMIRVAKQDVVGSVRVSCPPGLTPFLARLLPVMRERHPALAVELIGDGRTVDLSKGEADVALRMFRPTETDMVARRALELGWAVYASKAYVAGHGLPASIDRLCDHRLVLYVDAMNRVPGPQWIDAHRGPESLFIRVDNTDTASYVIATGGGIGVIPCFLGDGHPELVRVFPEPVTFSTGWLVFHEAARDTARVRAMVDAFADFLESQANVISGKLV